MKGYLIQLGIGLAVVVDNLYIASKTIFIYIPHTHYVYFLPDRLPHYICIKQCILGCTDMQTSFINSTAQCDISQVALTGCPVD